MTISDLVQVLQQDTNVDLSDLKETSDLCEFEKQLFERILDTSIRNKARQLLQTLDLKPGPENPDEIDFHNEKVCLVQRLNDGSFVFSNSQDLHLIKDVAKIQQYSKIKLRANPGVAPSQVPRLATASYPLPILPPRKPKTGVTVRPVEIMDFGIFSSFAPHSDSSKATLSSHETFQAMYTRRRVEILEFDKNQIPPDTAPTFSGAHNSKYPTLKLKDDYDPFIIDQKFAEISKLDKKELDSLSNLNWDKILVLADSIKTKLSGPPNPKIMHLLLQENAELIYRLQCFQSERYNNGKLNITEQEKIVELLEKNLSKLLDWVPVDQIIERKQIVKCMKAIPIFKEGYQGTLPPKRCFAYPSNEIGKNAYPPDMGSKFIDDGLKRIRKK